MANKFNKIKQFTQANFFKFLKKIVIIGIIIFVATFLQIYWAMGEFSDRTSSGCLDCSFSFDIFVMSLMTSIFLSILFLILHSIKINKYIKIAIEFVLLISIWFFWNYTIFVDRESSWSTYLFNEEVNYTLHCSFLPVLILTSAVLFVLNYKKQK